MTKSKPKPEMVRILCTSVPDYPWTTSQRYERSNAQHVIDLIEAEYAVDPTKGCSGPHRIVPA